MGRFIVIVLLIVLAVWLVRRALRRASQKTEIQRKPESQGELVRCARCGVHLPRAEARQADGRLYCGEEHARLGADPH